jgi:hypothetical protein
MLKWVGLVAPLAAALVAPAEALPRVAAPAVNCAALVLHLAPGVHPPESRIPIGIAPDAPRTPFTIAVPLYPGMTPLQQSAGSPFFELAQSPYLQTASAELHTMSSSDMAQHWYQHAMRSCGWNANGGWDGNAGPFPDGISFVQPHDRNTFVDIGFNVLDDGSTDVAIAAETVRYPAPPPRARIHGPFTQLRLALQVYGSQGSTTQVKTVHAAITDRQTISKVVRAIDGITAAYRARTVCFGGGGGGLGTNLGPVWLTFIRPNGSKVHAFEDGPGECGGLAVNGFRWLLDPDAVWSLVLPLAQGRG